MNHLEWHNHAYIDENDIVVNIAVFDSDAHDTDLIEQVREVNGYKQAICCCTFGLANIGDKWTGTGFISPAPYPSWLWDDEKKIWYPPVKEPRDGMSHIWDEESLSWIIQ